MRAWVKGIGAVVGGLAAVVVFYRGVSLLLPPVIPVTHPVQSQAIATVRAHHARHVHRQSVLPSSPGSAPVGPNGLAKMAYSGSVWTNALARARSLHLHLLLPTHAYPDTALEESYVDGPDLDLEFNNMLAIESNTPIDPAYQPASVANVMLADGVAAQWMLIYGVGGPAYRLDFQQDGTYVRLQLFRIYIPASAGSNELIASQFAPMS
ncbi:hypothetical protein [Sulfobacillus sp. hq2]|uniref:Uncharacterized protein n=1 Tax=Sulfobacillus thermotolerans TaxID=338644 RepID=A0ABM6RUQ8_9FIRM|nr:hypothetical protein [Sulfobacillus sp. hq2]AUW95148.1 hypothetical protein BXT84_15280 [Sulfobacillus thermotolerans]MCY0909384.1 hypothetical protein [Sulfobacillus thermotolerans]POB10242.1 hypothetical protein CO251_09780 [Sulfobacillus sp. hq2]